MKKLRLFMLLALISMLILTFVGCKKEDAIASLSLKDHDPNAPIEMVAGDFDYNAYTLVVTYESGTVEEIPLTEEMIVETDLFKLYQIGDHDIAINYDNSQYIFKVSVKRDSFGELTFPKDNIFTYDGKTHTIEVDGEIPANAVVTYIGGNSFVNAGTYNVTAVVSCEGYVTQKLSTTVKIERAKYDISELKLKGKEVVYDGNAHSVEISGTLPEGVSSPTYTINGKAGSSAIEVGEYKVKVTFANNDPNYEPIPELETVLKITPADYTVKGVDIVFKNENGNIITNASKIYDGKSITVDLNDYTKLSKKISVSFSIYDKDGKVISKSNKKPNIINAGVYTVKAEFAIEDASNYKPIAPIERTFEVLKAEYPKIENIQFVSDQTTYDRAKHSIVIKGQLPEGVSVSYEYYKNGVLVTDSEGKAAQSVIDAGRYTVKAIFTHTDNNLGEIPSISATLHIEQAPIDISMLNFEYNENWQYDGTPKSVVVTGKPENYEISYEYYRNGTLLKNADDTLATEVTEVGEYTVQIIISTEDENYTSREMVMLTFNIVSSNS